MDRAAFGIRVNIIYMVLPTEMRGNIGFDIRGYWICNIFGCLTPQQLTNRRILLQTMDKSRVSLKSYIEELKNTTERRLALKRKGLEFLTIIEQDALPDPVRLALDSNFLDKFIGVTSEFTKEIDEIADLTPFCVLWSKYCSAIFQILTGRIDDMIMVNGALAFQQILEEYQKEASFYTSLRLVFSKHKDEELQHNFEFIECFGLGLPWISRMKLLASDLCNKLSDEEFREERTITRDRDDLQFFEGSNAENGWTAIKLPVLAETNSQQTMVA